MYIYIYIYIYIHVHIYIHTYIHTLTIRIRVNSCTIHRYIYISIYIKRAHLARDHLFPPRYRDTCIYIYTHTYINNKNMHKR